MNSAPAKLKIYPITQTLSAPRMLVFRCKHVKVMKNRLEVNSSELVRMMSTNPRGKVNPPTMTASISLLSRRPGEPPTTRRKTCAPRQMKQPP